VAVIFARSGSEGLQGSGITGSGLPHGGEVSCRSAPYPACHPLCSTGICPSRAGICSCRRRKFPSMPLP
jgi:hypothetical protein